MSYIRKGIIICKENKLHEFQEIFKELIPLMKKGKTGYSSRIKKKIVIITISESLFINYRHFDNYLMEFSNKIKNNKNTLVIGHTDEEGFLWTDY